MIAVLHAGPGAVASHRAAAALWGLPGFPKGRWLEVTRPRTGRRRPPSRGVRHETRFLPPEHLTAVDHIPVTVVARTLFDCGGVVHPARVERAIDNALAMRLTTCSQLTVVTAELAGSGRPQTDTMRAVLSERVAPEYLPPASEAEAVLVALFRAAGMPVLLRQVDLGGDDWIGRVDFQVAGTNLVLEVQSYRHHSSKLDMEADARRYAELTAAGFRVLPVTWKQLTQNPEPFLSLVRRAVASSVAA